MLYLVGHTSHYVIMAFLEDVSLKDYPESFVSKMYIELWTIDSIIERNLEVRLISNTILISSIYVILNISLIGVVFLR